MSGASSETLKSPPIRYANELEREASVGFQRVEYIQAYFVVKVTVYSEIHFVMVGISCSHGLIRSILSHQACPVYNH